MTVCGTLLATAPAALANTSPPPSPVTAQLSGVPCSVTANFTLDAGSATMKYGGGVSCAGGVGQKTIDVVPQVFNVVNGRPLWFNLSLVGLYQGPIGINPLRVSGSTSYVATHTYRLLVYGVVTLPDGRRASATACSGCTGSAPALSIRPSHSYLARGPTAKSLPGIPCSVNQSGLLFTLVNGTYVLNYGAFVICRGGSALGTGTVKACAQVVNRINGRDTWFTISGSCVSRETTAVRNLFANTARTAYLGHGYRIMASATVTYPSSKGTLTRSGTLYSGIAAP